MSNESTHGAGHFTTFFTSISASDVNVPGLTPGGAGSPAVPSHVLTTLAALFTIGPDTAHLIADAARYRDMVEADLLAAD